MSKTIQLKDGNENVYPQSTPTSSSQTSFSDALNNLPLDTRNKNFFGAALNRIADNISTYSTGLLNVSGDGPIINIVLIKHNDNYYTGFASFYENLNVIVFSHHLNYGYMVKLI